MKRKVMLASLLVIRLTVSIDTQVHARDTAYLCGDYHPHMHPMADGCPRTLKKRQAVRDATVKYQTKATQRQAQATRKQSASIIPTPSTAVQPEAVDIANANGPQQLGSQTVQQVTNTTSNPYLYHESYDGIHQHSENCDGTRQSSEDYNSGM